MTAHMAGVVCWCGRDAVDVTPDGEVACRVHTSDWPDFHTTPTPYAAFDQEGR